MRLLIFLSFIVILLSCEDEKIKDLDYSLLDKYSDTVFIGYEPLNLDPINSNFDDFNSMPVAIDLSELKYLIAFSTNRMTEGKNFDITR